MGCGYQFSSYIFELVGLLWTQPADVCIFTICVWQKIQSTTVSQPILLSQLLWQLHFSQIRPGNGASCMLDCIWGKHLLNILLLLLNKSYTLFRLKLSACCCYQVHLIQFPALHGYKPKFAFGEWWGDVMLEHVFCVMWSSIAPYLLGLLRQQRNGSSVFVLFEITVCSWGQSRERGRGLV